jgi:hypothetical protein
MDPAGSGWAWMESKTYVLIDEVEGTVPRDEGGHLLTVLDQLNTNALTDGRVRLLRLNTAAVEERRP